MASANNQKPSKGQPSAALQKQNSDLQNRVNAQEDQLRLAREQGEVMKRGMMAISTMEPDSMQELRRGNDELRSTVSDMKDSIAELKRVASHLQPGQESQIKNLEKSLKKVQQVHNTLNKRLAKVTPASARSRVARTKEDKDLLARKNSLLKVQSDLNNKIAELERQSSQQEIAVPGKTKDFSLALTKSKKRVADLQKQLDAVKRNPAPVKNATHTKLSSQVENSEKQLAALRQEYLTLTLPIPVPMKTEDLSQLKTSIEQLKARRAILNESLQAIDNKYNLSDLTAKGAGTSETQLKDYLQVLSNENSALQEKLLILQMQQDKKEPTP